MITNVSQTDTDTSPRLYNHALPDELPQGERQLWQGSPGFVSTAFHVFHVRKVAIYFGALILWRVAVRLADGASLFDAATYAVWIVPMAAVGIGLLLLLAFLTVKTTIYTITSKRVVFRIGVALSMTVNVPFKVVDGAGLKLFADGSGDIALKLQPDVKAAYAVMWPHARRWHFKHPQPSLRSLPDAREVAEILADALAALPPSVVIVPSAIHARPAGTPVDPDVAYHTAAE